MKKVHPSKKAPKRTVIPMNLSNPVKKLVSPENILPKVINIYIITSTTIVNNSKIQKYNYYN